MCWGPERHRQSEQGHTDDNEADPEKTQYVEQDKQDNKDEETETYDDDKDEEFDSDGQFDDDYYEWVVLIQEDVL